MGLVVNVNGEEMRGLWGWKLQVDDDDDLSLCCNKAGDGGERLGWTKAITTTSVEFYLFWVVCAVLV